MIECSKSGFKFLGMILLQIFLQYCNLMIGLIDQLFASFSDTAIVWNIHGTFSRLMPFFLNFFDFLNLLSLQGGL